MATPLGEMAGDLNRLLSEVKVKPVVVKEDTAAPAVPAPPAPVVEAKVDTRELAREIVAAVFGNATSAKKASDIGEAIHFACEELAGSKKISKEEIFEAVMNYCIEAVESAQNILEDCE